MKPHKEFYALCEAILSFGIIEEPLRYRGAGLGPAFPVGRWQLNDIGADWIVHLKTKRT
jgi:hypothetical protein